MFGAAVKTGDTVGDALANVPLENQIQLLLGDGVVGAEAAVAIAGHQLFAGRPADGFAVRLTL